MRVVIEKEQRWQRLSLPVVPSPVFALAADRERLWAGGVGGVASYALAEIQGGQGEWQPGVTDLPLAAVTVLLALDEVLLAGGSEGIACSYNGGQSWQQAGLEDGLASITALAASPDFARDRRAVAATLTNGILRTDDGGYTWINASFGLESLEVNALIWTDQATLLAATSAGIYRSRDSGRAWRQIYAGEDSASVEVEALAALSGGVLLAALVSGELVISRDNGKSWTTSQPAPGAQALSLCATSTGVLLYGTLEHGLLRSDDAGASWQKVHNQAAHVCVQSSPKLLARRNIGTSAAPIYAGSETGVSVSLDDGRTWYELPCPPLHDLRTILTRRAHLLLAGTYTGIIVATPTGGWQSLAEVAPVLTACSFIADDALLLSGPAGLERLSFADGTRQMLLAGEAGQIAHIAQRRVDQSLHLWVASADGARLLYSADEGASWQPLSAPFGVLPLVAFQAVADRLIAATYDPRQYQVCLWYSNDAGRNWIRSMEAATRWPLVATCTQPAAVSIGNILFLERPAGRWQQVTVGYDGGAIRRVLGLQRAGATSLLVLTTTGIQLSDDLGATWQREHVGLPVEHIVDLALSGTTLFVLLTGGRVWQRELL
jgi:photosystem II stability/assembly factor-like uncharacterized protein